jgi:hypothetical protein
MQTNNLLSEIVSYVENLLRIYNEPYPLYHNFYHTRQVLQHAEGIAGHYELDNNFLFTVLATGRFHDTGHLTGEPAGIMATAFTLQEQIICVADPCHPGTKEFPHFDKLMWQETE